MLLELFPFVTLNNAMAFIYAYFFYLISIAYCHLIDSAYMGRSTPTTAFDGLS